jgi:methylmalonyl-CoA decarboxylase
MPLIRSELAQSIGTITLDNPAKRNALCTTLVGDIINAFAGFELEKARVVVLRAAPGVKVWSSGHDIDELPKGRRDPLGWDDPLRQLVRRLETFPAPVIAMIEGGVWGGACEVVLACDIIIAAPNATFAVTPARLGVPYNISGLLTFRNAANLRLVKERLFTAKPFGVERAERLGLINHVVPGERLEAFTYELAHEITANAPLSIAVMKEQLRILAGAASMSPEGFERIQGLRRVVYDSEDYLEGIAAFKEKRKPVFKGK